eukprot:759424-Hanusia_phi.AAC.5
MLRDYKLRSLNFRHCTVHLPYRAEQNVALGKKTWSGSLLLARYLDEQVQGGECSIAEKRVLELGCGTGLVGMTALELGAGSCERLYGR